MKQASAEVGLSPLTAHGSAVLPDRLTLSTLEVLAFAVAAGLLATFRVEYVFGLINQIEHLPTIWHIANPSLFTEDWHVQQSLPFGPRYYYYHAIAFLSKLVSLPVLMLAGTMLSNILTLLVSFYVARDLFEDDLAAMLGCALIAAVHSIDLGGATFLIWQYLIQASLAQPLALLALWAALRLKALSAAALSIVASLIHPVVGLETGGIALSVAGFYALKRLARSTSPEQRRLALRLGVQAAAGLVALIFVAYMVYLGRMEESLSDEEFFRILVYFRNPHHYVPGMMGAGEWGRFFMFLGAACLAWAMWRSHPAADRSLADRVGAVVGIVLVLMAVGYVFVELIPVRLAATTQSYRNIYLIKWIGLLLAGRSLAVWFFGDRFSRWTALIALAGTGIAQPVTLLAAHAADAVRRKAGEQATERLLWAGFGVLTVTVGVLVAFHHLLREYLFLVFFLALAFWFATRPPGLLRWAAPLLLVGTLLPASIALRHDVPFLRDLGVFTLRDAQEPADSAAYFARLHLPRDATVLTPPWEGRFRLVSQRAIVVDFKSFVFQDSSIAQWMDRMTNVYGATDRKGFAAAGELTERYRSISDAHLARVSRSYGAGYALLFLETPTDFPVIYEDENYRLVRLDPDMAAELLEERRFLGLDPRKSSSGMKWKLMGYGY